MAGPVSCLQHINDKYVITPHECPPRRDLAIPFSDTEAQPEGSRKLLPGFGFAAGQGASGKAGVRQAGGHQGRGTE